MVLVVDDDGSGQIEFPEFLMIIKGNDEDEKTQAITQFFKALSQGKFGQDPIMFTTFVNIMRRKYLIDAIKGTSAQKKQDGQRIMNNIKNYMIGQKALRNLVPAVVSRRSTRTAVTGDSSRSRKL
jgi:hypothetical protein